MACSRINKKLVVTASLLVLQLHEKLGRKEVHGLPGCQGYPTYLAYIHIHNLSQAKGDTPETHSDLDLGGGEGGMEVVGVGHLQFVV